MIKDQQIYRLYGFYQDIKEKAFVVLLQKFLMQNQKILILMPDKSLTEELDLFLWAYEPTSFLPHGYEDKTHAIHCPIWLTWEAENLNQAENLVLYHCQNTFKDISCFNSITEVFDINDHSFVKQAEKRAKKNLNLKRKTQYYRQLKNGSWTLHSFT